MNKVIQFLGIQKRNIQGEQLIQEYWTQKSKEYPKLALIILALNKSCPSAAEIERKFSKISNILTQKRSRLGDKRLLTILQTAEIENLEKL